MIPLAVYCTTQSQCFSMGQNLHPQINPFHGGIWTSI